MTEPQQTPQITKKRFFLWPIFAAIVLGAAVGGAIAGVWFGGRAPCIFRTSVALPPPPINLGVPPPPPFMPQAGTAGSDVAAPPVGQEGTSTELPALESELQSLDLTGLDAELNAMAQEIPQ